MTIQFRTHLFALSLLILMAFTLISCGTIADGQSQMITVNTPGAENAKCLLENKDMKLSAYSGQTVRVMKSSYDLVVRCAAPGNRQKTVLVKRELNGWSILNVANGFVPGVAYDYASRGLFDYPDTITVGFAGEAVKAYAPPEYSADDLQGDVHKGRIIYRGPSEILSEKNRYDVPRRLEKKSINHDDFNSFSPSAGSNDIDQAVNSSYPSALPDVSYNPTEEDK